MTSNDVVAGFLGESHPRDSATDRTYALAYARVSTEMQEERGLSLPAQLREIEDYASRHGIAILETFTEAASAFQDEMRRVEFRRMMERAKSGKRASIVLVHEFSRFCRDPWKTPQLIGELLAHGVKVVSVTEPSYDLNTIQGMWLQKVTEAKNASYSMEIAMHVRKGMRENLRRRDPEIGYCYKNGGQPTWGYEAYRVQRGTDKRGIPMLKTLWKKDETVVLGRPIWQWAREALLMAAKGAALDELRDFCNGHGLPAPRAKYWASNTWHYLLKPHALLQYAGIGVWNVRGKHQRWNPPSEWEVVENAHPAIITLEEAKAIKEARDAQLRMLPQQSGAKARSNGSRFLLSGGVFRCERCGANMVGFTSINGKGRRGDYYVCGSAQYRRSLGCGPAVYVDQNVIENAVLEGIAERFREWTNLKAFAQRANQKIRELHEQHASAEVEAGRQIAEIERKMTNLRRAIEDGLSDIAWANARLDELIAERERWNQRLEAIGSTVKPPELDLDEVRSYHERFLEVMGHGTNEERRQMVRFFVENIALRPALPSANKQTEPAAHELVVTFKAMPAMFVKGMGAGALSVSLHQSCSGRGW